MPADTLPIELIGDPARGAALLDGTRRTLLEALREHPDSASGLARRLGLPRQRLNYHLRELERLDLIELTETRQRRGCTERVMRPTAGAFLIAPGALGSLGTPAEDADRDRSSWAYLVSAMARVLRDLTVLRSRATAAKKRLSTLTIETEVRVCSAPAQAAFAADLTRSIAEVVERHHDDSRGGRAFRVVLGSYPKITKSEAEHEQEIA